MALNYLRENLFGFFFSFVTFIYTESGKLLNNQENDHYIITFSTYNSPLQ